MMIVACENITKAGKIFMYSNVNKKYINQLARAAEVKYFKRSEEEVIEDLLEKNGFREKMEYLEEQFKFRSPYLTLCQPEDNFPDKANTPEKFLETLVVEKVIIRSNINQEWRPSLKPETQICAVKHEGSAVYLKVVEARSNTRKNGYESISSVYAHFTSIVINFDDEGIIQLRCATKDTKKYAEFIMVLMGFAQPAKWFAVPKLTVEAAKKLCDILSAGVASNHIALPCNVGSVKFHGKKGINLSEDESYKSITGKIEELGYNTDHTMEQSCFFHFEDARTSIKIEATFEVNIQSGHFKFTTEVPEVVIDHVLEALMMVENEQEGTLTKPQIDVDTKERESQLKFPLDNEVLTVSSILN